ncbi:MAG TPA: EF-hand domain-containing protein [Parvularculaceae bacterium]|nr:EF-hand domain-containing protein [Parvularculaceae bacterium]
MRNMTILAAVSTAALIAGAAAAAPEAAPPMGHGMGMHGHHELAIVMAVLDANGDGAVTFDEVEAVHKRMFDHMDANKDGKLTPDEMRPPMSRMGAPMAAEKGDDDGAGPKMMRREVIIEGRPGMMGHGIMGHGMMGGGMLGHGMMEMGPMMMAVADTNNDGAVSFDEMKAVHKRIFNVIDANKDGKITLQEAEAFFGG